MKTIALLLLSLLCIAPSHAQAPSDASIQELLTVSQSQRMLDSVYANIDTQMKQVFAGMTKGEPVTPKQQQILDSMTAKMTTIVREEMAWDKLSPIFVQVYQQSLTQEEVDGMITFYKSPAGQALVTKMPAVMQNSMTAMRPRLDAMMPRIKELADQTKAELDAAK